MALDKPRVYVIATGGSIACVGDSRTDFVDYPHSGKKLAIGEMLARIPEVNAIAEVRAQQFLNVGSNDVRPSHWLQMAKRINRIFPDDPDASGIVCSWSCASCALCCAWNGCLDINALYIAALTQPHLVTSCFPSPRPAPRLRRLAKPGAPTADPGSAAAD